MRAGVALAVAAAAARTAGAVVSIPFMGPVGPDGPWQAARVPFGNSSNRANFTAMWPSPMGLSVILTKPLGGNYSIDDWDTTIPLNGSRGNSDALLSSVFQNESSFGIAVMDTLIVEDTPVNASISAVTEFTFGLPDGRNYTARAGILGLGRDDSRSKRAIEPPSILEQLSAAGGIESNSFTVHMGSVELRQRGSLILGGYEQNRALGTVGVFPFTDGIPRGFLRDVVLGTERGGSPFGATNEGSIFKGLGGNDRAADLVEQLGGKRGSVVVLLNPSSPYIYLPEGTCETAAAQLPVTMDDDLGLYIWNTSDPRYSRIVNSPAYLGFVLADLTATNITVKVPFKLLDLTLEPPLVTEPTRYFPCKPFDSPYLVWQLGRAFLQAAFLGFNLDKNVTFLAQAPGPDMDQSVMRTIAPGDTTILSNSIDTFAETWRTTWTELPSDGSAPAGQSTGLSGGGIAGVVVGCLVILIAVAVFAWWCIRRRKRAAHELPGQGVGHHTVDAKEAEHVPVPPGELDGYGRVHEVGKPLAHEMDAPHGTHEALVEQTAVHELPSSPTWRGR
jgi:hypothetical protein